MIQVTISAIVGEDRQLHITLPDDFPLGPVEVTITPLRAEPDEGDDKLNPLPPGASDASQLKAEERHRR